MTRSILPVAVASLFVALPAAANGRFPLAQDVVFGGSSTVVLRTTFGLVVSDDGGKSFRYVCEEAVGYGGAAFDPAVGVAADGRVLVGLYNGLSTVARDRCAYPRVASLEGEFVRDLDVAEGGAIVSLATYTGFVDDRNAIFRSEDGGKTFTRLGAGLKGVGFETVEMAASDTKRVYATGVEIAAARAVFYRSTDGGSTLIEMPLPIANVIGAYVSAIDRKRPDRVYVRVLVDTPIDASGTKRRRTLLLRSDDGGATWTELARSQGLMLGFALSADGKTIYWGGPDPLDGLQRSIDDGASFTQLSKTRVHCLRERAGVLWVCAQEEVDGFALARSIDRGATLVPALRLAQIEGVFPCTPEPETASTCRARLAEARKLFPAFDAGPPDAPAKVIDASASDVAPESSPSEAPAPNEESGCATSARRGRSISAPFAFLIAAIAVRRRRGA